MMNKAIKYRIYPTNEQAVQFAKTFGCCRKIYNLMLEDKIESYKMTKNFGNQTPAMYKKNYPYLKEVDSLALANVQWNLQSAFKNCFSKTRKKKNGFPKFKSAKRSKKSYKTNNQKGSIRIQDNHIKLPKVGYVKVKVHRIPPMDWQIKSVVISKTNDDLYYASVLFEYEQEIQQVDISNQAIGLDYASDGLYIDDTGKVGTHHKYYRESQKRLKKIQRNLSRKKGSKKNKSKSNNYLKQLKKLNKLHRHIANQRLDNLHKKSTEIANQYDVVCVENLNMKAMSNKGFGNGKATLDNGYGMFLQMLEYKLKERGKYFVKVDKWFPSSQICHACGSIHPEMKDLRIRTLRCECGMCMNRDQNAAINIKNEGLRILKESLS